MSLPNQNETEAPDSTRHRRLRSQLEKLHWNLQEKEKQLNRNRQQHKRLSKYLKLAPQVTEALKTLSSQLFEQDLRVLQEKMTIALQEVLGQPIKFRAEAGFKGNVATVDFSIERDGYSEDLRRGQGGSVHNILSVGLRMFALTTLGDDQFRRFLMLDEQDCWLQPELVPKLVKIVHQAGKELGYQVIMISHHQLSHFSDYADRIYRFEAIADGIKVSRVGSTAHQPD